MSPRPLCPKRRLTFDVIRELKEKGVATIFISDKLAEVFAIAVAAFGEVSQERQDEASSDDSTWRH
jgi:ABC-type sugar transport system ATPase subunit